MISKAFSVRAGMGVRRWTALLATTALAGLSLSAGTAFATETGPHRKVGEFGSFSNPNGIAVDETEGNVYVADIGTNKVYKFDANGTPVNFASLGGNELTGIATPAHAFLFPNEYGNPAAIAVDNACAAHAPLLTGKACEEFDPSAGDVYVMDAGHGVIDKFSPEGTYLSQIGGFSPSTASARGELLGLGVDGAGTVHVDLSTEGVHELVIDEFDHAGVNIARQEWNSQAFNGAVGVPDGRRAHGFAVSAAGDDYPIYEPSCSCTLKWGQRLSGLGRVDSGEAGDLAVAVDPATGHLYADDQSSVAEWDTGAMNRNSVQQNSSTGTFDVAAGTLVARFGSLQLSGSVGQQGGIAVNGASGQIYISNPANRKVYIFASDAPAVTASAAGGVTRDAASLGGTVDPHGIAVSSCQFEWGLTDEFGNGPYSHSVPCKQTPTDIGAGSSPVAVSAQLEGLKSGELYHFRLVASNANGAGEGSGLLATQGEGFGIKPGSFDVSFLNEDGTPDAQAGSHPYQFVDSFELNSHFKRVESNADSPYLRLPDGVLRDVTVDLPAGFVGDPNATPKKCTGQELSSRGEGCSSESVVGNYYVNWSEAQALLPGELHNRLVNMVPPRGVALQLGSNFFLPLLYINSGVLAGGDYPVQATATALPAQAPVFKARVVISGVVGEGRTRKPFLTMPTGCHGPLRSTMAADSWDKPGQWVKASTVTHNAAGTPVSLTGCSKLKFPAEISVAPDTTDASTSSGLAVGVHVPQTAAFNPDGLAESALRDTTVTLPEGVAINPAGADGLEACSEGLAGFEIGHGVSGSGFEEFNPDFEPGVRTPLFTPTPIGQLQPGVDFCPDGSKIGTVKLKTPLLEHELEGAVYLASQNANPFGSLVAMYIMIEDPFSGSTVKLTGEVQLSPTGQIVTTFKNTPDLPFEDLAIHFFGGERAPLSTPARCGKYTTTGVFTPWDGNGPVTSTSSFNIDHGPNGGPCPGASLPFNASLTAGTTSIQAGGLSPFTMTMSRDDGNQNLQAISLHMPPGLSGLLTGVELCGEAKANSGTCGPGSLIGQTIVSVGVGNDPFTVTGGRVYLTGPYRGAPFGLSIVNPAKAGPYDLGQVIVRAKIEVDPITAQLTVTSDNEGPYKIPTMIDGIPLQIKHVNVTINRPGFTFNPTDCEAMGITGTLDSTERAVRTLGVPFQAANCARLAFAPKFAVSTSGRTSKAAGASLHVKLTYPSAPFGTQANIHSVKVELPLQLPSRLTTLQKACTEQVFDANPAACSGASIVGRAKAITPLLPVPVEGPAYFVSHGGAKFPELIVVLQGYGVTIYLHGETFISKKGITSSTFSQVPDVPVGSFELTLPQGPYSALAAGSNLCTPTRTITQRKKVTITVRGHRHTRTRRIKKTVPATLQMPTSFVAQNGATLKQSTRISVTGCAKHRARRAKRKTRAARRASHSRKRR